ncbi:hypothetical protein CEXT_649351 [Caerostris extrusa]|uniref:Uncharacterized protein n=1 Tax=Caerostris extrusa TaxID=172846 RepID=A0AAV4XYT0_CAEEX|nr:hypothetical protein CEXT_649351 [Caerostris extrusa]
MPGHCLACSLHKRGQQFFSQHSDSLWVPVAQRCSKYLLMLRTTLGLKRSDSAVRFGLNRPWASSRPEEFGPQIIIGFKSVSWTNCDGFNFGHFPTTMKLDALHSRVNAHHSLKENDLAQQEVDDS